MDAKQAVKSAEITGQAVWDGKDMAVVQMLMCDLREQGFPAAVWDVFLGETSPGLLPRPGAEYYETVPVGATIDRNGLELRILT